MALSFKLEGDVLEVTETIFACGEVATNYWYYNIKTWVKSSYGDRGDVPDRVMSQADIDWVRKYYLPKVVSHE